MHELSIALSILDVAAEEAARRSASVKAIHLKLGPLAGVVKEALVSAFTMAREQSELPDADLVIEDVPIRIACPQCRGRGRWCPSMILCAWSAVRLRREVTQGREMEVVALEIA